MPRKLNIFLSTWVCLLAFGPLAAPQTPGQESKPVEEKKPVETVKPGVAEPSEAPPKPNEPPLDVAAPVDPRTFLIGPEDVLFVRVWREPEVSGAHAVRPDGKITLPLVGDIPAGGLTPEKLKDRVTLALSEYIKEPQVSVFVQQVNSKKYYITGEANKTGPFPLITPITVFEAINSAGGLREFAKAKKIIIWRHGKTIDFNYKDVVKGKNLEQNIYLEPGDHIIVP